MWDGVYGDVEDDGDEDAEDDEIQNEKNSRI